MARVTGLGGVFLKAQDPKALMDWYAKHLGVELTDFGGVVFVWNECAAPEGKGSTIWSLFPSNTKHFGPGSQQVMLNLRVDDMDALLAQLASDGVEIDPKRDEASYGKFAWITDGEGNRVELWQPLPEPASE